MDRRTTGMIATLLSVLLCGLPGLCLCIFAALAAVGAPFTTTINGVPSTNTLPTAYGWSGICLALLLMAIPFVVGFLTLRNRPAKVIAPVYPPAPTYPSAQSSYPAGPTTPPVTPPLPPSEPVPPPDEPLPPPS